MTGIVVALVFLMWFLGSIAMAFLLGLIVWAVGDSWCSDKWGTRVFWVALILLWGKGLYSLAGNIWIW